MTQFLQQNQTMKQTHILTHKNQQALKILKMDSRELLELISECVQQNPFLDFHPSAQGDDYLCKMRYNDRPYRRICICSCTRCVSPMMKLSAPI